MYQRLLNWLIRLVFGRNGTQFLKANEEQYPISIFQQFDFLIGLQIGLILMVSTIVVRISGFGAAVIGIPLMAPIIQLTRAVPVMSLAGVTNAAIVVSQQWRDVTVRDMWRNIVASVAFVPFGIWLTFIVSESVMRFILGTICILYAIYNFANLPRPHLKHPGWGWGFGIAAGLLSGAFGVGGIPTVIFAHTQNWEPDRFRLNMFSYFLIASGLGLIPRYLAGQFTDSTIAYWLFGIPFLMLGLAIGKALSARIEKAQFRLFVLTLLIVIGGRLIWGVLT